MAKPAIIGLVLIISSLFMFSSNVYARTMAEEDDAFLSEMCAGKQKHARLRLYVHDLRIGNPNATVFEVAKASVSDNSTVDFGSVHVLDDLITAGPDMNSKVVGRIQGLTTSADLNTFGIAMNLNFFFTTGKFNGSTLSILGRNQVLNEQREMPVVGGSGVFRLARGYAIQTSGFFDRVTNYAVLEYNIYVIYNPNFKMPHDMEITEF